MASGAALAPQMEQTRPPNRSALGWRTPKKSTNSLELSWKPLSGGLSEGPPPKLSALLASRTMATEGRPKKASPRWPGPVVDPEGRGALGDQVAPSQSLDALDHLTHGRL
jgi:hypothetical protein